MAAPQFKAEAALVLALIAALKRCSTQIERPAQAALRRGTLEFPYALNNLAEVADQDYVAVVLPWVMKSCFLSRDQAKALIRSEAKFVIWWGGPPDRDCSQMLDAPFLRKRT